MNSWMLRRMIQSDYENLFGALSSRQYLQPHEPVEASLTHVVDALGVCPGAIAEAVKWLQLDPATPIGRLRRTELTQLARSIHRFWRQRSPETAPAEPGNRPS